MQACDAKLHLQMRQKIFVSDCYAVCPYRIMSRLLQRVIDPVIVNILQLFDARFADQLTEGLMVDNCLSLTGILDFMIAADLPLPWMTHHTRPHHIQINVA